MGRNLFLLQEQCSYDPDGMLSTSNRLQGVDLFGMPTNRSIGFNLKVNFLNRLIIMKNILKYTATALLAASMFTACTGAFDDLNTDPKGVSDEELKQDNNYIGMHFYSDDAVHLL